MSSDEGEKLPITNDQGRHDHFPYMEEILFNHLLQAIATRDAVEITAACHSLLIKLNESRVDASVSLAPLFEGLEVDDGQAREALCTLIWRLVRNEDFPVLFQHYMVYKLYFCATYIEYNRCH